MEEGGDAKMRVVTRDVNDKIEEHSAYLLVFQQGSFLRDKVHRICGILQPNYIYIYTDVILSRNIIN